MAFFNKEVLVEGLERSSKEVVTKLYENPIAIGVLFSPGGKEYQYLVDKSCTPNLHAALFYELMTKAINPERSIFNCEDSELSRNIQLVVNGTIVHLHRLGGELLFPTEKTKTLKQNNYFVKKDADTFSSGVDEINKEVVLRFYDERKLKQTKTEKDDSPMKTTNSIMSKIGNKVSDVFAMSMTGGFATKLGEDYYTVQESQLTRVTDFIMGDFSMDGYTMPTTVSAVKVGDLISTENGHGIVLEISNGKEIKMITAGGTIVSYIPVKDFPMLPEAMVLTVMNPMGQQVQGGTGQPMMNPMMFMMMGKDKGGDNDMFKMMAMSQMMGGQNPMTGMFGTPVVTVDEGDKD